MSKRRQTQTSPSAEEVQNSIATARALKQNDVINARGFAGDAQLKVVRTEEVEVEGSALGDVIVYVSPTNQRIRLDSNYVNASKYTINLIATTGELAAQPKFTAIAQSTGDALNGPVTSESASAAVGNEDKSESSATVETQEVSTTTAVANGKSSVEVETQPPLVPLLESDQPSLAPQQVQAPSPPAQGGASETVVVEGSSLLENPEAKELGGDSTAASVKVKKNEETIAADILEEVLSALVFKTEVSIVTGGEQGTAIKCPGHGANGPFTWELDDQDLTVFNSNRGFDVIGVRPTYNLLSTPMSFFMWLREAKKKDPGSCSFIVFNGNPNGFDLLDEASFAKLATTRVAPYERVIYHEVAQDLLFISESQSLVIGSGTLGESRTLLNLTNFKLDTCSGIKENTFIQFVALAAIGQKHALDGYFMEGRGRNGVAISQVRYLNDLTQVFVLCLMRAVDAISKPFTNVALVYSLPEGRTYLVSIGSVLPRSQEAQFSLPCSSGVPIDHYTILGAFRSGSAFLESTVVKSDGQVFQTPRASAGSAKGNRQPFAENCKIGGRGKMKAAVPSIEDESGRASGRQPKRAVVEKSDKTPVRNFEPKAKAPADGGVKRASSVIESETWSCDFIDLVGDGPSKRHVPENTKEPAMRCPQQPAGYSMGTSDAVEAKLLREMLSLQTSANEKLVQATEKGKNEVIEALKASAEDQKANTQFVVKILADERCRGQEDSRHVAEHSRLMSTTGASKEIPISRCMAASSMAQGQIDTTSVSCFQKASEKEQAAIRMRQQAAALPEGSVRNALFAQASAFDDEVQQLTAKGLELIAAGK